MSNEALIPVFLSRPNPYLDEHDLFIDKLKSILKDFNIETITLQADNYDLSDSIEYLKGMIKQCYGIIIIGFGQILIKNGRKKPNAVKNDKFYYSKEEKITNKFITSPFCHIEGTIGLIYDLPLLIMNESNTRIEGIISGGRFSVKTITFDLKNINDFFDSPLFNKQLSVWIGEITKKYLFLQQKKI